MEENKRRLWTRTELILAINLYCKTPFGKIHTGNPKIIALARRLNRTPGSVSYKLANFASIDPSLPRKGATNVSKLDKEVWQEFFNNWEDMAFQSEMTFSDTGINSILSEEDILIPEGKTKNKWVKTRVNQRFFRETIIASYGACCITGIPISELLVASHIVPWSKDKKNRTNPRNGLCLNCLHDKAFDAGFISISEEYSIIVSPQIEKYSKEKIEFVTKYEGEKISLPKRFIPDQKLLEYHRNNIYRMT